MTLKFAIAEFRTINFISATLDMNGRLIGSNLILTE